MFDLNTNLMKDGMTRIMKAQFSYNEEAEAKPGHDRPGSVNSGRNQGWQPFVALLGGRKLQEPKQS